ncbi:tenascin-N-like [Bombina bombina]|uniref:tenascin-N-like n=1 Tax=Bombina bombina TaxID=8345 RepID=UPI00235B2785|nr:tenascin-N-like [Bombina bombina]
MNILVRFLLCCPLYLSVLGAVITPKSCESQKGLTITHVYSPEDGTEPIKTVNSDDQNLIFRHHIRLQTPDEDCEKNKLLAGLLARMSALEEEMMGLKEEYQFCCGAGALINNCNGNGQFIKELGRCQCADGWEGPDCSIKSCPNNCAGNGICIDGVCQCAEGFTGPDCSEKKCAYDCGEFGQCIDGFCQCAEGYTGPDCSEKKCAYDCGEFGQCIDGFCQCAEGYTGPDCSEKKCAYDCGEFGQCIDGFCQCAEGYTGPDCSEKKCAYDCGEFGKCIDGFCQCAEGYTGLDCREKKCAYDCGEFGKCIDGSCQCAEGYTGLDCREKKCAYDCGRFGKCVDGVCKCAEGYTGPACRKKKCPFDCGEFGKCVDGVCQCAEEYTGPACRQKKCAVDCGPNGRCVNGKCVCNVGYMGISCSIEIASLCSGNGKYQLESGTCQCDEGWEGPDCSQRSCPNNCGGNGICIDGVCQCASGFTGPDCSEKECLLDCGENGKCVDDSCQCAVGYTGPTCRELDCLINCGENGRCDGGQCFCEEGFIGESCSEVMAVQNLRLIGSTEESLNIAWDLLMDADYYLITYYPYNLKTMKKQVQVSGSEDSNTLLGLNSGTLYTVLMYQVKNGVTSNPAELQASTEEALLGTLWVTEESADSLEVEWENPPNEVDYFKLKYAPQPGGAVTEVMVPQSKDPKSRYIITGLEPSTMYEISVRSVRGAREGKASTVVGTTGIDGPKNLVTTEVGEDTASLSWEAAKGVIDKYVLRYTSLDGVTEEIDVDNGQTTTLLSNLIPGMEYTFQLWAERGEKRSKRATATATTDIDSPKDLEASEITQTEAMITWTPPIAQIDGYILTYEDSDGISKEIELDAAQSSYKLEGLSKGLKYTVYLRAFRGARRSRQASTFFYTLYVVITHPIDCSQALLGGNKESGVYTIYPGGDTGKGLRVYCDQTTDGGGWIVFQRRDSGKVDFYQKWRPYIEGFGDPAHEYWLGLEWLHKITSTPVQYELRVDLRAGDDSAYAKYKNFQVGSSKERYRLTVSDYSGTAGDALTYHNGWKFTTWDKDNDIALTNCALSHRGAFWYKNCHLANPNGRYGETNHSQGINWEPWKGHEFSIPFVEMKIRPYLAAESNI